MKGQKRVVPQVVIVVALILVSVSLLLWKLAAQDRGSEGVIQANRQASTPEILLNSILEELSAGSIEAVENRFAPRDSLVKVFGESQISMAYEELRKEFLNAISMIEDECKGLSIVDVRDLDDIEILVVEAGKPFQGTIPIGDARIMNDIRTTVSIAGKNRTLWFDILIEIDGSWYMMSPPVLK